MLLFELFETESHPAYQKLSMDNLGRQYDFLQSAITAALSINRPHISSALIKALNFHAIACLHVNAGQYRPWLVGVDEYKPPLHYRVPDLMEDLVNDLNYHWHTHDPVSLATYALWRLCYVHPFMNGNGRTARALCYYIICSKLGGPLPGKMILPELIRSNRDEYVALLKQADAGFRAQTPEYIAGLHDFITRLLGQQLASVDPPPPAEAPPAGAPPASNA